MWDIIPNSVKELNNLFTKNGKQLFLVGGSVRDFIIGVKPKDFDLATDALPDEVISRMIGKYTCDMVGKAFGVVIVYTDDVKEGMEIATFRQDISKGRNPKVRLGATIYEDTQRRDYTINGLFYDINKKEIVDLVGGLDDISNKVIRFIGDPIERLDEDSLRLLRGVRFKETYEFEYDPLTLSSMKSRNNLSNFDIEKGEMVRISQDRIIEEIFKSFKKVKNFDKYLNTFTELNMWDEIFPNITINEDISTCLSIEVYLAKLFKHEMNNSSLENILVHNFKLPAKLSSHITFLYKLVNFKDEDVHVLYKKKVALCISDEIITEWAGVLNIDVSRIKSFLIYKPVSNSEELMSNGFQGKELGTEIKRLEAEHFKKIAENEI